MADWESTSSNGLSKGGGFGRGFGRGGSNMTSETGPPMEVQTAQIDNRLRGFGRGRSIRGSAGGDSSVGVTSSGGGGFGRGSSFNPGSGGGFGRGQHDDAPSSKRGGGGGGGGFNSRGGFPSRGDDNSGSRSSDEPRGGGFESNRGGFVGGGGRGGFSGDTGGGRSSGGGNVCHKCGEEGHFARECPKGGGDRRPGGTACHKCNQEGHFARECPNSTGGGSGGSSVCYKCNKEGHFARECPDSAGGGGGGGGGGCYKCGESGHFARECPNEGDGQGRGSGGFGSRGGGGSGAGGGSRDSGAGGDRDPNEKREIYVPPAPSENEEEIFKTMQQGINFNKYDDIPVECTGDDKPNRGIMRFLDAQLHETLLENIVKAKYDKPTPVQKWAIPIILNGRDLMSCAQTGSGKTAAFLLPVLTGMLKDGLSGSAFSEVQEPQALVVGPTRELVVQIYNEARKFAHNTMLRPVVVYGGTSVGHQLRQVESGTHLLVGTPGRLLDFINRGKISLAKIKYLILDEADRMLDMGFKPEISKMVDQFGMPPKTERQTLMFSATFPDEVQTLAKSFLNNYLFVTVGKVGGANVDITQTIHSVTRHEKREKLCSIVRDVGSERVLVFVEQKRNADFLASFLSQSDFPTTSIHGDRLQREREEALLDFKRGRARVLVATSVAARGLDIPDVMHVVNYDMPSDISEYVHRIGRTGRCGNTGKATSFFDPDNDSAMGRALVKILQEAQQEVPDWLEEVAQNSFGAGGFTGIGGEFASRDTRRGKYGSGNDDGGCSNGYGGGSGGAAVEEESWD